MPIDAKSLPTPPDIEDSLRNPQNEHGYRADYFNVLAGRAMSAVGELVKDNPDREKELLSLFEGREGETIVEGNMVKALSEAGLLRVNSITGNRKSDMEGKGGWFEWQRMKQWEKEGGPEIFGVVERYWVELPSEEAQAPVTKEIALEVRQQKLEGETNRYGGTMWGDKDYDKWTLVCR